MKLYRLSTWAAGRRYYVAGSERPQFVDRKGAARLYTRTQAAEVKRRFAKVKTRLKLEAA